MAINSLVMLLSRPSSFRTTPSTPMSLLRLRLDHHYRHRKERLLRLQLRLLDESNATYGKRLDSRGLENTEANLHILVEQNIVRGISLARLIRRTLVSIPNGTSALAVQEAAWGLARYTLPFHRQGLCLRFFFYLAQNNIMFEGVESKDRASIEQVASYTLKLLRNRIPPAVPGIIEATPNLNAMNKAPNPMARVLLLCTSFAKHLYENMQRQSRERECGSDHPLCLSQGQFVLRSENTQEKVSQKRLKRVRL
ncbi:unnamed protein product [Cochlearia groenlandica]